jgi:hypothetical protein
LNPNRRSTHPEICGECRHACREGLRSALQNEVADGSAFTTGVAGQPSGAAFRTAVFDTAIRVESVQHTLMAVVSWLTRSDEILPLRVSR